MCRTGLLFTSRFQTAWLPQGASARRGPALSSCCSLRLECPLLLLPGERLGISANPSSEVSTSTQPFWAQHLLSFGLPLALPPLLGYIVMDLYVCLPLGLGRKDRGWTLVTHPCAHSVCGSLVPLLTLPSSRSSACSVCVTAGRTLQAAVSNLLGLLASGWGQPKGGDQRAGEGEPKVPLVHSGPKQCLWLQCFWHFQLPSAGPSLSVRDPTWQFCFLLCPSSLGDVQQLPAVIELWVTLPSSV